MDKIMRLSPLGGQQMGITIHQWLDQMHVDANSARLQIPGRNGPEKVDVEASSFDRHYRRCLEYSLEGLHTTDASGTENFPKKGGVWSRRVSYNARTETLTARFAHNSGRHLYLDLPVSARPPSYQRYLFGVQARGMTAQITNYLQSEQTTVPQFNAGLQFALSSSALEAASMVLLGGGVDTPLPSLALHIASEFRHSQGYFVPGPESRLRLTLSYTDQERPQFIALSDEAEGLRPQETFVLHALKTIRINSISESGCYFNISAHMQKKSLEIYCTSPNGSGEQSLRQQPMPGRLWDFACRHTGLALDKPSFSYIMNI